MKRSEKTGIVVKITKEHIVLLCEDGAFKNLPRSENDVPAMGETMTYTDTKQKNRGTRFKRKGLMYTSIASVLLLIVMLTSVFATKTPEHAYVIAVDINPSLEIYTDDNFKVTNVSVLNTDGERVIRGIQYEEKDIFTVMDEMIHQSVQQGYLTTEEKEYVVSTIIPLSTDNQLHSYDLKVSIEKSLTEYQIEADVWVTKKEKETMQQAHEWGISVNKSILYKQMKDHELAPQLEDMNKTSVAKLMELKTRLDDVNASQKPLGKESPERKHSSDSQNVPERTQTNDLNKSVENHHSPELDTSDNDKKQQLPADQTNSQSNPYEEEKQSPPENLEEDKGTNEKSDHTSSEGKQVDNDSTVETPEKGDTNGEETVDRRGEGEEQSSPENIEADKRSDEKLDHTSSEREIDDGEPSVEIPERNGSSIDEPDDQSDRTSNLVENEAQLPPEPQEGDEGVGSEKDDRPASDRSEQNDEDQETNESSGNELEEEIKKDPAQDHSKSKGKTDSKEEQRTF